MLEMPWVTAPANAASVAGARSPTTVRAASTSNSASMVRLSSAAAAEPAMRQPGRRAQAAAASCQLRWVR